MVYSSFPFNPKRDKTPVSPSGFVDLQSAMVNHAVPSQIPGTDDDYNGIEEPQSILGKPRDVFEAMDMQKYVNEYKPGDNASE